MSTPRERLSETLSGLYGDLSTTVGAFGLQFAGEGFDGCTDYHLRAGSKVEGYVRRLLGTPPMVPGATIRWGRILDVEINLHRPAENCLHVIATDLSVDQGWVEYDENSGNLTVARMHTVKAAGSKEGPLFNTRVESWTQTFEKQLPGEALGAFSLRTHMLNQEEVPILDPEFAVRARELVKTTSEALESMRVAEFDFASVAPKYRLSS